MMERESPKVDSADIPIEKTPKMSRWSEIPPELLQMIQSKLPVPFLDVRSLVTICSSWRVALEVRPLTPLLFSLPSVYDFEKLHMLSVQDMKIKMQNSILQKWKGFKKLIDCGFCVGFSHGWLVVLDKNLDAFLLNPFLGDEIQLPNGGASVPDFVMDDPQELIKLQCTTIKKAILSCNPSYSNDYKVVIICNKESNLAICSNGDECWSWLSELTNYSDIAFNNNKIYALHDVHGKLITEVWDMKLVSSSSSSSFLPEQIVPLKTIELDNSYPQESISPWKIVSKTYIVISSMQEIYYVRRYMETSTMLYRTVGFKVFRMDSRMLVEVKSLQNRALFLGGNENKLIPSQEYQGLQGNCIYFLDDSRNKWIDKLYPYLGYDMGVYMLQDRRLYLHHNCPYEPMPYWVLPTKCPFER